MKEMRVCQLLLKQFIVLDVLTQIGLVMAFVMMKITSKIVTMMVGTVVDPVSIQIIVMNANALIENQQLIKEYILNLLFKEFFPNLLYHSMLSKF